MITPAHTDAEILATFEVMAQLRPQLTRETSVDAFHFLAKL